MRARLHSVQGFSLIETLVAMVLVTIGALAMATTFVGAASINRRVADRQKATTLAQAQLDKMRSLAYSDVLLASTDSNAKDLTADSDWTTSYCPLRDASGNAVCASAVTSDLKSSNLTLVTGDPRQAKVAAQNRSFSVACKTVGGTTSCPTVRRNGILLYTYIYWNNWKDSTLSKQYKLATVVARYGDPVSTLSDSDKRRYNAVTLTSIIADIPQVGQAK